MKKQRITVRLTENQMLVLSELVDALDTSYSMLVRSIVADFLTKNEQQLENIIIKKMNGNALDTKSPKEDTFTEEGD